MWQRLRAILVKPFPESSVNLLLLAIGYGWVLWQGLDSPLPWWHPITWLLHFGGALFGAYATIVCFGLVYLVIAFADSLVRDVLRFPPRRARPPPPSPPAPPKPTEVGREELWYPWSLVAERRWTFVDGRLQGMHGQFWDTSVFDAVCRRCEETPGWDCRCGVYATKGNALPFTEGTVSGRVELTGLVIEHETGYRAERARIVELTVDTEEQEQMIARRYPDVPVRRRVKGWRSLR